ncbi:MAG: YhfC family intramembrane metalloprotease [Methanolinea sp.]|nr:YhfC family intramembrane metalloprotease [Methanolinea sp.]
MNSLVVLTFFLAGAAEIAIPLLLGYFIVRKFGLNWKIFVYGALFFILSQLIHIPLLYVLQPPYAEWVVSILPNPALALIAIALFLGLFAGVLEEGIRYLVFSRFFRREHIPLSRENGLLFGAGWGGIECIFVAFLVLAGMVGYITVTSGMLDPALLNATLTDPNAAASLAELVALTPLDILPGLLERMMTIILHIMWTLLVLLAVLKDRMAYLFAAIAYHGVVDVASVYLAGTFGIWPTEAAIVLFAALGAGILWWIWNGLGERREPDTT